MLVSTLRGGVGGLSLFQMGPSLDKGLQVAFLGFGTLLKGTPEVLWRCLHASPLTVSEQLSNFGLPLGFEPRALILPALETELPTPPHLVSLTLTTDFIIEDRHFLKGPLRQLFSVKTNIDFFLFHINWCSNITQALELSARPQM